MDNNIEQRICLKFCYTNEITAADAFRMLQEAYGDAALSRISVFDWYRSFKEGRTSLEDMPHGRRPTASKSRVNIEKVKQMLDGNDGLTEKEIVAALGISYKSAHCILSSLKQFNTLEESPEKAQKPTPEEVARIAADLLSQSKLNTEENSVVRVKEEPNSMAEELHIHYVDETGDTGKPSINTSAFDDGSSGLMIK